MERHFDDALQGLKNKLLDMGGLAEAMIHDAVNALIAHDPGLLEVIPAKEDKVNRLQVEIDEACLCLIARHQPTASDLRLLLGIAKINSDLERLGDHAVNIAGTVTRLLAEPQLKPFVIIPEMVKIASGMVKDSLHAFLARDTRQAREILQRDHLLNEARDRITLELQDYMARDPNAIARGVLLIIVARNLERIGDLAKNICEDVIFVAEGRDIRHGHAKPG